MPFESLGGNISVSPVKYTAPTAANSSSSMSNLLRMLQLQQLMENRRLQGEYMRLRQQALEQQLAEGRSDAEKARIRSENQTQAWMNALNEDANFREAVTAATHLAPTKQKAAFDDIFEKFISPLAGHFPEARASDVQKRLLGEPIARAEYEAKRITGNKWSSLPADWLADAANLGLGLANLLTAGQVSDKLAKASNDVQAWAAEGNPYIQDQLRRQASGESAWSRMEGIGGIIRNLASGLPTLGAFALGPAGAASRAASATGRALTQFGVGAGMGAGLSDLSYARAGGDPNALGRVGNVAVGALTGGLAPSIAVPVMGLLGRTAPKLGVLGGAADTAAGMGLMGGGQQAALNAALGQPVSNGVWDATWTSALLGGLLGSARGLAQPSPAPIAPPVSPAPTTPPVSPAPTTPPASPAPTTPPVSPAPTTPPASPAPTTPSSRITEEQVINNTFQEDPRITAVRRMFDNKAADEAARAAESSRLTDETTEDPRIPARILDKLTLIDRDSLTEYTPIDRSKLGNTREYDFQEYLKLRDEGLSPIEAAREVRERAGFQSDFNTATSPNYSIQPFMSKVFDFINTHMAKSKTIGDPEYKKVEAKINKTLDLSLNPSEIANRLANLKYHMIKDKATTETTNFDELVGAYDKRVIDLIYNKLDEIHKRAETDWRYAAFNEIYPGIFNADRSRLSSTSNTVDSGEPATPPTVETPAADTSASGVSQDSTTAPGGTPDGATPQDTGTPPPDTGASQGTGTDAGSETAAEPSAGATGAGEPHAPTGSSLGDAAGTEGPSYKWLNPNASDKDIKDAARELNTTPKKLRKRIEQVEKQFKAAPKGIKNVNLVAEYIKQQPEEVRSVYTNALPDGDDSLLPTYLAKWKADPNKYDFPTFMKNLIESKNQMKDSSDPSDLLC